MHVGMHTVSRHTGYNSLAYYRAPKGGGVGAGVMAITPEGEDTVRN